eukprot:CAMPEP_0183327694 /NCGR_PEP_ID=MMETSP0160_2-20130417/83895_1 /TAXON_ID=2839 ORGANISM="Odontella Sinensis, Strain Grunow 1884" /NCGR_SAMPLE_ID=MMETSP0160_2 /ASSEMBLY_ACC=CAM_ASM_000250 /LENGTH=96 /DNA_ID=CAMNT_0025495835 /DNA_START=151 /DNA_END=441 /DNA_ORIENTATION=-
MVKFTFASKPSHGTSISMLARAKPEKDVSSDVKISSSRTDSSVEREAWKFKGECASSVPMKKSTAAFPAKAPKSDSKLSVPLAEKVAVRIGSPPTM